eukprot:gene15238-biopygen7915
MAAHAPCALPRLPLRARKPYALRSVRCHAARNMVHGMRGTSRHRTARDGTGRDRTGQGKPELDGTDQGVAGQDWMGQDGAGQDRTDQPQPGAEAEAAAVAAAGRRQMYMPRMQKCRKCRNVS